MRFASFVTPHTGGTFSFHRTLRDELGRRGVKLLWVGADRGQEPRTSPLWQAEAGREVLIEASSSGGERQLARETWTALVRDFDGVIVHVLADHVSTNLVRYLPPHILRLMVVHNITPATYAAARSIRPYVHAAVGVSERCRSDLVTRHGFACDRTLAITHAVDLQLARGIDPMRKEGGGLRVIYLGRVEDASKGVLWLPKIMADLPGATLTVAGDGPDLERLRSACRPLGSSVRFEGRVSPPEAMRLLAAHDAMIMPSRFEGFGLVLIEAMAAGCVPVAALIRGVTDTIVTHGQDGLLFPVGDWKKAAHLLRVLDRDRDRRDALAIAGQARVQTDFAAERMGAQYAALIEKLAKDRPPISEPLAIEDWRLPRGLRTSLRTYLPAPMKNHLRVMRERLRVVAPQGG